MSSRSTDSQRIVQFVCEHGAFRSCIAAAYFNVAPPAGWHARSAGREPQAVASPALEPLLAGTSALDELERDAPAGVRAGAERTVAIDCDAPADEHWVLAHQDPARVCAMSSAAVSPRSPRRSLAQVEQDEAHDR